MTDQMRRYNRRLAFAVLVFFIVGLSGCSLLQRKQAPEEKPAAALELVLAALKMQRGDLGVNRPLPQDDPFLLHSTGLFLRSPLAISSYTRNLEETLGAKPHDFSSLVSFSAGVMELVIQPQAQAAPGVTLPAIENLPAPIDQAAGVLCRAVPRAKALLD